MKVSAYIAWYDMWIGAYWDRDNKILYICPLPCVVIRISPKAKKCGTCGGAGTVGDMLCKHCLGDGVE